MEVVEIKRCSVRIASEDISVIDRMYPYTIVDYNSLRPLLMQFLREHFDGLSPKAQVLAISQHNGRGKQWGVVVLQRPEDDGWEIVGRFGMPAHAWHRIPPKDYYMLLARGIVPRHCGGHEGKRPNEPVTLAWLRRLAAWYDKCSKMSPFDLFFKGAPAI